LIFNGLSARHRKYPQALALTSDNVTPSPIVTIISISVIAASMLISRIDVHHDFSASNSS
jgi:hypothetical protein